VPFLAGDHEGLARQRSERGRAEVVGPGQDDAAEIETAQAAVDLRVEIGAPEPEQEQLCDLALERQPPR
jgi:hypothetical protein